MSSPCYSYLIKLMQQCHTLALEHTSSKLNKSMIEYQDVFDINKVQVGQFLHPIIRGQIKSEINKAVTHSFVWEGLRITLHYGAGKISWKRVKEIITLIKTFVSCLVNVRQDRVSIPHLNCIIVDLQAPKKTPASNFADPITSEHVNSGLFDPATNTVIVYRKEEIQKVLVHELIHALSLDAKHFAPFDLVWFNKVLGISCNPVLINETFTDALACLLLTVHDYVTFKKNNQLGTFHNVWTKQVSFIKSQAALVWKYYNEHKNVIGSTSVCESTNVSAYYILKAVLLWKPKKFLEFLVKHGYSLSSSKTAKDDFVNLLKEMTIAHLPELSRVENGGGSWVLGKSLRMSMKL